METAAVEILKRHHISYANCSAGVYEVGWAQRQMLDYIETRGPENLVYVTKFGSLAGGTVDVEGVLQGIRLTLESNDAFRTRYLRRDGQWLQEILGSGDVSVAELSATSPQLDAAGVVALLGHLAPEPDEVPVRVAMVTFEGRPTHVYLAIHHASVDNMGAELACQEICRRSLGLTVLTSAAWQPRQIVEFEGSPAGRAVAERADRYHRARIRELADLEGQADRPVTPLREYQLTSPAVVAAAQQISRRVDVSAVSVTMAAYCAVLSARLSEVRFPVALTSGNRFNPNVQMSITKVAQASSLSVDVTVPTFEDFCHRMNRATLLAYRYGSYDPELMAKSFHEVNAECGRELFFPYLINFHLNTAVETLDAESRSSRQRQAEADLEVGPRELRQMLDRGVWGATEPEDGIRFCDLAMDIYEFSDQADMRLRTDMACFPDTDLHDLLISTERLLVDVACGSGKSDMQRLLQEL